jgi:hypothetical protein
MAKKATDPQIVKAILDDMHGQANQIIADKIVRVLGKRIRQRRRDSEDVNQAAASNALSKQDRSTGRRKHV